MLVIIGRGEVTAGSKRKLGVTMVTVGHITAAVSCSRCEARPGVPDCASFACSVTRSTTTEFQHNDIIMKTTVQNDLRLEMALESMWIVCAHEKSNN